MALVNENYLKLPECYVFYEMEQKINAHKVIHPNANIIRLGQGDVSRPLPDAVIIAMQNAVQELSDVKTFRGYGPEVDIAITDPVYPVYENAAIMGGRSGYITEDAIWSNMLSKQPYRYSTD